MALIDEEGQPKQKRRGAILVFESLRDDILWLRIAPGTAIDEVDLAARFAVSRTPIREALLLLEREGLVQFLPNRTSIVAHLLLDNLGPYMDTLLVLARTVGRAAALSGLADATVFGPSIEAYADAIEAESYQEALRIDLDVQRSLADLAQNSFLKTFYCQILDAGMRARIKYFYANATRDELRASVQRMKGLVDAVVAMDADAADDLMRDEILESSTIIQRALRPKIGHSLALHDAIGSFRG